MALSTMWHLRSGMVAIAIGVVVWFAVSIPLSESTWERVNTAGVAAILAAVLAYVLLLRFRRRRGPGSRPSGRGGQPSRRT